MMTIQSTLISMKFNLPAKKKSKRILKMTPTIPPISKTSLMTILSSINCLSINPNSKTSSFKSTLKLDTTKMSSSINKLLSLTKSPKSAILQSRSVPISPSSILINWFLNNSKWPIDNLTYWWWILHGDCRVPSHQEELQFSMIVWATNWLSKFQSKSSKRKGFCLFGS